MRDADLAGLLAEHASTNLVPGAAVGVLRDGETITAYYGVASTATHAPVTPATRFAIGSLGKSMVATALARLVDAGRLSFDDPIAAHVPELGGTDWAERATIRDLLANRSRLPMSEASEFSGWTDDDDGVLSRVAAAAAVGVPLPPVWSYTNAGWCLLGRALEAVTGLVWEEAMHVTVLRPCGMARTTFTSWPSDGSRVSGHTVTADGVVPVADWTPRNLGPAGSTLQSTATDLLEFASVHLIEPSLAMLRHPHADIRIHGWFDAWCLGWARFDWSGGPVWGWDGVIAGQRSILRLLPDNRGAVVLLTNSGHGRAMYRSMFPDLMRDLFGIGMPALRLEPPIDLTVDLSRFGGVYAWPDRRWEVTATDTGLTLLGPGGATEARPIDDGVFLIDAENPDTPTMTFGAFDDRGRPGVLYQMLWGLPRSAD